ASGVQELVEALAPLGPRTLYQRMATERTAGSWARTLVRHLPSPARTRLKTGPFFADEPDLDRAEQSFLAIMAGRQEFTSVVDSAWKPVLTEEESLERVLLWLDGG
ncbi:MAG: hypothetical protein M3Q82_08660, partial [Actinomycetota bacterium]|nr:hypothetical protein [Actinomycetota bacterium]